MRKLIGTDEGTHNKPETVKVFVERDEKGKQKFYVERFFSNSAYTGHYISYPYNVTSKHGYMRFFESN